MKSIVEVHKDLESALVVIRKALKDVLDNHCDCPNCTIKVITLESLYYHINEAGCATDELIDGFLVKDYNVPPTWKLPCLRPPT